MKGKAWKLMEPMRVGGLELRNRVVMPAMENIYNNADGSVSQQLIDYYAERARGGVGLIVIQNTHVDTRSSRSACGMLSIATGHMIAGLSRLAEAIHEGGARAVIQLGHGGRQCNPDALPPGMPQVAPSPVPCFVWGVVPKELTLEEIREVQAAFGAAAERAQKAGLDGVEIHGAHGYLIGQFLSPLSNKREDDYGGALENRARFALEVIDQVRGRVGPNFTVGFRMSGDECLPGGLTPDESVHFARIFARTGKIDYISVSAGTYESIVSIYPVMYSDRGPLLHLAARVKGAVGGLPVIAVGALDAATGEQALQDGKADLIAVGRGLLADPELPAKVAEGRPEDIRPCIRCNEGCFTEIASGRPVRCTVNPACGREGAYRRRPAERKKKVLVVGGGIAGMEAARLAACRGHRVTLLEKESQLGGHLAEASASPFKQPIRELLDWSIGQLEKSGVRVRLNTRATPARVEKAKPDVLILALGSEWNRPFGGGSPAMSGREILRGSVEPGEKVLVIGGGSVGCETALHLAEVLRRKVTVIEMLPQILSGMEILHMMVLSERLAKAGVEMRTGWKVVEVAGGGVICEDAGGQTCRIEADSVVACTGFGSRATEAAAFERAAPDVHAVGDCAGARNISGAFRDAHRTVLGID
ncbi:MAG: NAD(P)/FAD-dependent oxidoreductase [bacterium]